MATRAEGRPYRLRGWPLVRLSDLKLKAICAAAFLRVALYGISVPRSAGAAGPLLPGKGLAGNSRERTDRHSNQSGVYSKNELYCGLFVWGKVPLNPRMSSTMVL